MKLQQKPKKSDTGLTVEIHISRELVKDLVKDLGPWLMSISAALLTVSGILLSSDFSSPGQVAPAPTEARE